jgi:DNA-binding CsgD family transcriptional regulator
VNDDWGLSPSPAEGNVARTSEDWSGLWFAQDAVARLVVRRDLMVLQANAQAERLLDGAGPISIRDGAINCRDRRTAGEVANVVTGAGAKSRFTVIGAAILVEASSLGEPDRGPVALTLRDLNAPVEIECAELEPVFGVTPGEHQVIVQLLNGYSSREIAESFGKSILTVRTHVKRAYGKIGVKTRGQLFARLLPYLAIR